MSLQYTISYGIVLFICFLTLGILLLKNTELKDIKFYDDDDNDDGGAHIPTNELPDFPLPPGIIRPINDWEPEYNKKKTYA